MKQSISDDIGRQGYAFATTYHPEMSTNEVAESLGQPIAPFEGRLVQELTPRATSTPNTYSGIYGLDRFPYHTDLAHWPTPPRYLILRCQVGYSDIPTLLTDGFSIIDAVTLDTLTRAIYKPRRPRVGVLKLLRLCERIGDDYRLRWDGMFLRPASRIAEIADQKVRAWLTHCDPLSIALAQAGDTLVIDNWRMLHARSPIPVGREDRKLERIYLESLH